MEIKKANAAISLSIQMIMITICKTVSKIEILLCVCACVWCVVVCARVFVMRENIVVFCFVNIL